MTAWAQQCQQAPVADAMRGRQRSRAAIAGGAGQAGRAAGPLLPLTRDTGEAGRGRRRRRIPAGCAQAVPLLPGHFCPPRGEKGTPDPAPCRRQKSAGRPGEAKARHLINGSSQVPAHCLISHWPLCRRSIRQKKKKKSKVGNKKNDLLCKKGKKKKSSLSRFCSNCRYDVA